MEHTKFSGISPNKGRILLPMLVSPSPLATADASVVRSGSGAAQRPDGNRIHSNGEYVVGDAHDIAPDLNLSP